MRFWIFALACSLACAADADWPAYGKDGGGTRFSPAKQIRPDNVAQLKPVWTYHTGALQPETKANRKAAFEATPIVVDGVMYFSTPFNHVIALNPSSGRELWKFDPKIDRTLNFSEVTSRGVSTWLDPKAAKNAPCARRIFEGTIDARLIALDAKTGSPCKDFGSAGQIDLGAGIQKSAGNYQVTSPPAVIDDRVIVGTSVGDNGAARMEAGTVRAYDARSGRELWRWDPLPKEMNSGAANAWAPISVDEALGLVFVPTSSPSPDFYGGERPGDDRYGNSVVALNAASGKMAWHFQVVHHDLWDYDVAAQPALITMRRSGKNVDALVVGTKMGFLFFLDRKTGKPLIDVVEKPVPQSSVEGEKSSATQPFPINPAVVPQSLTPEDAFGANDQDKQWCREKIASLDHGPIYTPPSIKGSLAFPGNVGGIAWGGLSYSPQHHTVVTFTNRLITMVRLIPRADFQTEVRKPRGDRIGGEFGTQTGTPYAMYREILLSPSRVPCNAPPWGALVAVDSDTGAIRWQSPVGGFVPGSPGGSPGLGGTLLTAGGLAFVAATFDGHLRAFDIQRGKELWSAELPAGGHATPMSFEAGGRQFIVIAAGGHGKLGTKMGDSLVAFALP